MQHQADAVEDQLPVNAHAYVPAGFAEFPGIEAAACRQAQVYAWVIGEVLRRGRLWAAFKERWRSDDDHADIRADRHGDHVLVHDVTRAHACIAALGHDIDKAVIDGDFNGNAGIAWQQRLQRRPENHGGGMFIGRNADGAGGAVRLSR